VMGAKVGMGVVDVELDHDEIAKVEVEGNQTDVMDVVGCSAMTLASDVGTEYDEDVEYDDEVEAEERSVVDEAATLEDDSVTIMMSVSGGSDVVAVVVDTMVVVVWLW